MVSTWWREVWQIINSSKTSTGRTRDGGRIIRDAQHYRPLSLTKQQLVNDIIENEQKTYVTRVLGTTDSLADVKQRSAALFPMVVNNYKSSNMSVLDRVKDAINRDIAPYGSNYAGGMSNASSNMGVRGQDPSMNNRMTPNIWISPMEAAGIYSQKGLPEIIIRKKSQTILLNGVKIKCKKLTPEQNERVADSMLKTGLAHKIAESIAASLTHGGGLLYPVFKKDTPGTMDMPVATLARLGIIGKDCIDHYTCLDRWNVVHIPNWNPTAKDFLQPEHYYIPFLGADVSGQRCSRIVTAPQTGYWGNLMTLGWGLSDIPGWIESIYNYYNVMSALPNMINQMSILVRTINADGLLATEGATALDDISFENTVRIREISAINPINMDVIGKLESINRDFKQVPELVRLIRQDAAAKATIPEELLWSSERGAFSSGDSTDSAYEKQSEGTRYIHIDVANQHKTIAQMEVINALGVGRDVIAALPYVTMSFDNPRVTNAKDKAEIAGHITKGMFDLVAAGIPANASMDISQQFSDDEFQVSNTLMEELKQRQAIKDQREEEKHNLEMELLAKQIETTGMTAEGGTSAPAKPKKSDESDSSNKKGHSYSDRLEQKKHEKVGDNNKQGLQKAEAKIK